MLIHSVLNLAEVVEGSHRLAGTPSQRGHLYLVLGEVVAVGR